MADHRKYQPGKCSRPEATLPADSPDFSIESTTMRLKSMKLRRAEIEKQEADRLAAESGDTSRIAGNRPAGRVRHDDDERAALASRQAYRTEMAEQAAENAQEAQRQAKQTRQEIFEAKVEAIRDRHPDALAKFYAVPCSDMMADYLSESDKAGEMAAYLGSNPHEARRIASLGLPTLIVMEGGYALDALGANVAAFLGGLE